MKSIKEISLDACYGCGACESICPKNAISMETTSIEGYLYPVIDEDLCISCGKCVKVCPSAHRYSKESHSLSAIAIKTNKNIAEKGSSAGIFKLVADYVLAMGGYVCGAVFDDNFNVCHKVTNSTEIVDKMRSSKYVQSNMGNCYKEIKDLLEKEIVVLFSGTPCQVAGLSGYLGKEYDNLITMGIVCHGVPSPGMWRKYLDENFNVEDIADINFRHKGDEGFWGTKYLKITYKDGHEDVWNNRENHYYTYFLEGLGLRKSCFQCEYHVQPYSSDFLVGDYWGADKDHKDWIDGNRMSIVLLNSEKAANIMLRVKNRTTMYNEIDVKDALNNNIQSVKRRINPKRKTFYQYINKGFTFTEALERAFYPTKYDVLIFGPTFNRNYGTIITYFALSHFLNKQGYTTAMYCNPNNLKRTDKRAEFCKTRMTNLPLPSKQFVQYNWVADTILVGSDQVWNYPLFKDSFKNSFYLDFANDETKKISYASSFGFEYLKLYEKDIDAYPLVNSLMKRFDSVSVRESQGVELAKREHNIEATQVLDPVFLLDQSDYNTLANDAERRMEQPYIATYIIGQNPPSKDFNDLVQYTSNRLQLPVHAMIMGEGETFIQQKAETIGTVFEDLSVEEWLDGIKNAEFVVTSSFHCTCFSIIFRKKFIILNSGWGLSRIVSLLDFLGLRDRHLTSYNQIEERPFLFDGDIDWDNVYKKLDEKRAEAAMWLNNALKSPKNTMTRYRVEDDLINKNIIGTRNFPEYFNEINKKSNDYIFMAVSHGDKNLEEKADYLIKELKDKGVNITTAQLVNSNILKAPHEIKIIGTNSDNQRFTDIRIKKEFIREFKEIEHTVYAVSFDWKTDSKNGRFKLQLGSAPWDDLVSYIDITPDKQAGHFETIYMTSNKIHNFESDFLQIRLDGVEGEFTLSNLKMEKGNRVTSDGRTLHGFALISDLKNTAVISTTSMGKVEYSYKKDKYIIEYQNEGFRELKSISEMYIENQDNRLIYPCSAKGYYFFLYSKRKKAVIDIAYSSADKNGLSLTHI